MKFLLVLAITGLISTACAGTMVVHKSDGTVSRIPVADIQKITFDLSGGTTPAATLQHKVRMALANIFPNPFNPSTAIEYTLGEAGRVRVRILDARGALVRVMEDGLKAAGSYSIRWDSRGADGFRVSTGTYILCLENNGRVFSKKMVFVK